MCWFAFAGASAGVVAGSAEALTAFQHQAAAVANTHDLERNWWALVCLTDSSLNTDLTATSRLRQQMSDMAVRVQSPRLTHVRPSVRGTRLPESFPSELRRGDHLLRTRRRDRPRHGRPALVRDRPTVPRHGIHRARRSRRTEHVATTRSLRRSRSAFGPRSGKPSNRSRLPWRGTAAPKRPPSSSVTSTRTRPDSGSSTAFSSAIRHANSSRPTVATTRTSSDGALMPTDELVATALVYCSAS